MAEKEFYFYTIKACHETTETALKFYWRNEFKAYRKQIQYRTSSVSIVHKLYIVFSLVLSTGQKEYCRQYNKIKKNVLRMEDFHRRDEGNYMEPQKEISLPEHVEKWEKSEAYQDVMEILLSLNSAVKGRPFLSSTSISDDVKSLLSLIEKFIMWVDEIKPIEQPQRYGNKAFREFYAKLKDNCPAMLKEVLPEKFYPAVLEVSVYLIESLGNATRIDYGTGHELSFIMFLTCLFKIGFLKEEDAFCVVAVLFKRYIELARKLQMVYKMEPAGSQGVWNLDDYQFVPFIWGSSQLCMNPKITPDMLTNEKVAEENAESYIFFGCIKFILSVLSKFPVVQHILFGSILCIKQSQKLSHSSLPKFGLKAPMMTGNISLLGGEMKRDKDLMPPPRS